MQAFKRFGRATRTLAPLHSLGEFCYVVRRAVIEAIGAADEAYGDGPCWEMDYNIRAARAGFHGLWVCASYVYRLPWSDSRREIEAQRFEASKRRYQDQFVRYNSSESAVMKVTAAARPANTSLRPI